MIRVQTNLNVIYFLFLFNVLSKYPKELHPLGKKLLNRFEIKSNDFKKLERLFLNKEIPNHPYQIILLAINSNEDLTPKSLSPDDGYGPRMYGIYSEKMYSLISKIEKGLNFFAVFKKEFMSEYESICKDIQKYFDGTVEKTFKEVWQLEDNYNFFLIPNFLLVGEGAGIMRENDMYSISSPVQTKENTIDFYSQHLISNCIHELSHCILQRKLISEDKYEEVFDLTKDIEIPERIRMKYGRGMNYTEETFIRVFTLYVLNNLYKNSMSEEEISKKTEEKLSRLFDEGFVFSREFYKNLEKEKKPFKAYIESIDQILKGTVS
jgi:hypothetical protein